MLTYILIAIAPVIIILFYVYFRDKYEKEPLLLLSKGLVAGMLIVIPVVIVERFLVGFQPADPQLLSAAYEGFVVAAFTEEAFKFLALVLIFWKSQEFNEKFDGIVYAVFVSLGFALVENIMYVINSENSMTTGILRAFTAVPAHAIFGIVMGYHLGNARFSISNTSHFTKALLIPILFHGIYDFLLMTGYDYLLIIFFLFVIFLYRRGLKRMRQASEDSAFKPGKWTLKS